MTKNIIKYGFLKAMVVSSLALSNSMVNANQNSVADLGNNLTPMGAERSGNKDGSIPEWTGGLDIQVKRGDNPFSNEQPLYVVTNDNQDSYQTLLSPGQRAMMKKYPDSFKMKVYPTHRTARYPERIYAKARANASSAKLVNGAPQNFDETVPFAIPSNGEEAIWNHLLRYRGGAPVRDIMQAAVQSNGEYTPVKMSDEFMFPWYLSDGYDPKKDANVIFYFKQLIKAPTRLTGNTLLVHETLDQVKQPRLAWVYNSGQRRVRRAPQVAYDGPGTAADGLRTADNYDMFNGATDKYNWKLIGKKEMLIPYNSFEFSSVKYNDLIRAGHMNPEHIRYEKHRVWVVEATLKEGVRHIYAKRTFYLDEDTWQIAAIDHYDGRGELWRVGEAFNYQYTSSDVPWTAGEAIYDLQSGRYIVMGLSNEEKPVRFDNDASHGNYTPAALRRSAKR